MVTKTRPEPFHKSIIGAIHSAQDPKELRILGYLICNTETIAGHRFVASTFADQAVSLGMERDPIVGEVCAHLLGEKTVRKPLTQLFDI